MNDAIEDAQRLMRRARSDLKALANMRDVDKFDDNIFGFHAQQAVEKTLKAWLACLGGTYPFRHDLGELVAALAEAGENMETIWPLADLTPFAVQMRYDDLDLGACLDREHVESEIGRLIAHVDNVIAGRAARP